MSTVEEKHTTEPITEKQPSVESTDSSLKIRIPTSGVTIVDKEGTEVQTSLLDINYVILAAIEPITEASTRDKMIAVAGALNMEYDCQLSWGEAAFVFEAVQKQLDTLKKNS